MEDNVPEVIIKNWGLAEIQQPEDDAKTLIKPWTPRSKKKDFKKR